MNTSPRIRIIDNNLQTTIKLWKQTDEAMDGALARAGVGETDLYIDINRDHPFIHAALAQTPVNRPAFNLIILYEIALLMAEKPELVRTFVKLDSPLIDELDQCESYSDRVRKLVRAMIDTMPEEKKI